MKKTTDKSIGLITLIVIALICVPLIWFTLGTTSGTASGWRISPRVSQSGEIKGESVILQTSGTIDSIYVNVGDIYSAEEGGKITFTVDFNNSAEQLKGESSLAGSHRDFTIFQNGQRSYGWVKLAGSLSYSQKYVKITSNSSFELNEVVFTDKKGNRLQTTCYGGLVWRDNVHKFVSAKDDALSSFSRVTDEQGSFEMRGLSVVSDREAEVLSAISNLLKGEGYHISTSANVLGVELITLGVLVFGENSLGLRIIPFLFFVATLYLLFFFGKKIFRGNFYGMLTAVCYFVAGIGLCLGGLGLSYSIAVFFAVASLWFTYNLFSKGMVCKNSRDWQREAIMSALFLTLAVLTDISALILLPLNLVVYISLTIKAIKSRAHDYKTASGLDKEYTREALNKTIASTIICFVVFYAVLPLLVNFMAYGLAFASYASYYATENLFTIIFSSYANLYNNLTAGSFFPWIIGMGSQSLTSFGGTTYIVANKALVLLSTLSVLALAVIFSLVKKQKIVKGGVIVGIKDNEKAILFNIYAFAICWIANVIFMGKNEYYSFVYTLIPALFAVIALFKVLQQELKKGVYKAVAIVLVSIVGLFFLAQVVTFLQIAIPSEVAKYLYGWML